MKNSFALPALAMLAAGAFPYASAVAEGHFHQHDAHVHGVVTFNLAQDGNELLVEITAPGADIVGFEHEPSSLDDKEKLARALATLQTPDTLLSFPSAANCQLTQAEATETLTHRSHDEHEHGEFSAQFLYQCNNMAGLTYLELHWFEQFPATEQVNINAFTAKQQKAATLKPGQPRFHF